MADETEPHVEVWTFGHRRSTPRCPACGVGNWTVVTIPKLSTGEHYPQFGTCSRCAHTVDMRDQPPFRVAPGA